MGESESKKKMLNLSCIYTSFQKSKLKNKNKDRKKEHKSPQILKLKFCFPKQFPFSKDCTIEFVGFSAGFPPPSL